MNPGADDKALISPAGFGLSVGLDTLEAPQRAVQEEIKPASQMHDGDIHLGKLVLQVHRPPIRPILRMPQILEIPRG